MAFLDDIRRRLIKAGRDPRDLDDEDTGGDPDEDGPGPDDDVSEGDMNGLLERRGMREPQQRGGGFGQQQGQQQPGTGMQFAGQAPLQIVQPTTDKPRAMFHDPYSAVDWGGWRNRPSALTYDTLRTMSMTNPVVGAIINLRINQVASFCTPQKTKFDRGFKITHRDRQKSKKGMSPVEQREAEAIERYLETTGALLPSEFPRDRDSFRTLCKKFVRDTLTYDQAAVELIRDRGGKPSRFVMLPSETIRPAVSDIEHMEPQELRSRISHVQVYEQTVIAEFTSDELAWGVMNPRSDIRVNGFGLSPLEQMVSLVTAWLWGFQHNCLAPGALIHTSKGLRRIEDLAGEKFSVWTGQRWASAVGFETDLRPLRITKLSNGTALQSSPDHQFRVIDDEGRACWRKQHELAVGDYVLCDRGTVEPPMDEAALCVGETFTAKGRGRSFTVTSELVRDPGFWEMVGFALGDGHWGEYLLGIFPHYENDAHLFDRFLRVCERHSITANRGVYGKRVRPEGYPSVKIQHRAFLDWLYEIGFHRSSDGKTIPASLYAQPSWVRAAVLRGLFSADGHTRTHVTGYRTPTVCAVYEPFRQSIALALASVGVAAAEMAPNLRVQDIRAFVERVGYLQDYKNADLVREDSHATKWDLVHPAVCADTVLRVREHERWGELPLPVRRVFYTAALGGNQVSRPRMIEALTLLGEAIPEELIAQTRVRELVTSDEMVPMYDLSVLDDERHFFFANGVGVKNSNYFRNGASIKGLINIKGAIPDRQLRAFRRMWYTMVAGNANAWKTPIVNSEDLQWVPMQMGNKDMEFGAWMDWLCKLTTALYGVDPTEINFIFGNSGQTSSMSTSRPNEEEVKESKDKGLLPLLDHTADFLNRHIIQGLNPDFEFVWGGYDAESEKEEREGRQARVKSTMTVNEARAEEDLPPLEGKLGDVILDSNWIQWAQAQQAAADAAAQQAAGGIPGAPGAPPGDPNQPPGEGQGENTYDDLFGEGHGQDEGDDGDDGDEADEAGGDADDGSDEGDGHGVPDQEGDAGEEPVVGGPPGGPKAVAAAPPKPGGGSPFPPKKPGGGRPFGKSITARLGRIDHWLS